MSKRVKSKLKLHRATIMSDMGSFLVLLFVVALLIIFSGYTKIINIKDELESLKGETLKIASMYGGLTDADKDAFYDNITDLGLNPNLITWNPNNKCFLSENSNQVYEYGTEIDMSFTIDIPNPIFEMLHADGFFNMNNQPMIITIPISGHTTSKW